MPTSEADKIIARAYGRQAKRQPPRVDWTAQQKMIRRQRAALTRATRSGDPERIVVVCRDAVAEWNSPGCIWPDDWPRWQSALDSALGCKRYL